MRERLHRLGRAAQRIFVGRQLHDAFQTQRATHFVDRRARNVGRQLANRGTAHGASLRDPGSASGVCARHCGHSSGAYDTIGRSSSAKNGTPNSAAPRCTIAPTPATAAPCARTTSITSRTDPPVVTTSSTISARSSAFSAKPRRSAGAPSCFSTKIALTCRARATSYPRTMPPTAALTTIVGRTLANDCAMARAIAQSFAKVRPTIVVSAAVGGIVLGYEVARALHVNAIFVEKQDGAPALRRGFALNADDRALIVEDVVTTGGSVREVIDVVRAHGAAVAGVGAIVQRGAAEFGVPFFALLDLPIVSYAPEECPQCRAQTPLADPGSRR